MLHIIRRVSSFHLSVIMLSLLSFQAIALDNDTEQPLNIVSKEQIADFNSNKAIFLENVIATQGTIEVHSDKAEITRDSNDELEEIIAYGKPATYKQLQESGKIIHSQSSIIHYLPKKNLLILIGRATIWQENSHVDGERIEYNTVTKQLKATNENSQDGRVQSTFIPQELKSDNSDKSKNQNKDQKK